MTCFEVEDVMRLINTRTLDLNEIHDENIPNYVILSHCWRNEEVAFEDFDKRLAKSSPRYREVYQLCTFLNRRRCGVTPSEPSWVWVDS